MRRFAVDTAGTTVNVVVVEPNGDGHRFYFVRLVAEEASRRGWTPILVTTEAAATSIEYERHLASIDWLVVRRTSDDAGWRSTLREALRLAADGGHAATVVVPDADRALRAAFVLLMRQRRPHRVALLAMRPRRADVATTRAHVVKRLLAGGLRVTRRAVVFGLSDPCETKLPWPFVPLADPIPVVREMTRADARATFGIPEGAYVLACIGRVSSRKNLDTVVRAFASARERLPGGAVLLVAGLLTADVSAMLGSDPAACVLHEQRRLVVRDEYLSDADLDAAVRAADAILILHANSGSSGIFNRALQAGCPVLAPSRGNLGACTETLDAGLVVDDPTDPGEVAAGLVRLAAFDGRRHRIAYRLPNRSEETFASALLAASVGDGSRTE